MDLSKKNNINPKIWGPYFWDVFHMTAFGYPDNPNEYDKKAYEIFYFNFAKILPCTVCSEDSREMNNKVNWNKILESRDNLIKWTYDYHDIVNKKLGKISPDFNYFKNNLLSKKNCDKTLEYAIILVLCIILIMHYTLGSLFFR